MVLVLNINGDDLRIHTDPETPLLWVLRDELKLTATKYGCGIAQCGACTVLIDGVAMRSCQMMIEDLEGVKITSLEGFKGKHALQKAWVKHNVPQCGYCQSGQIMSAAALLSDTPNPSDREIDEAMAGNICRCGTYQRIRAAIKDVASGQ